MEVSTTITIMVMEMVSLLVFDTEYRRYDGDMAVAAYIDGNDIGCEDVGDGDRVKC
jgi:hypothetical protein